MWIWHIFSTIPSEVVGVVDWSVKMPGSAVVVMLAIVKRKINDKAATLRWSTQLKYFKSRRNSPTTKAQLVKRELVFRSHLSCHQISQVDLCFVAIFVKTLDVFGKSGSTLVYASKESPELLACQAEVNSRTFIVVKVLKDLEDQLGWEAEDLGFPLCCFSVNWKI